MTDAGPLLAALDVGTGSLRALVVDGDGRVMASAARPVDIHRGEGARVRGGDYDILAGRRRDLYLALRDQFGRAAAPPDS
ncbi:MAG: hypothetical protein HYU42_13365 [Candidatus Rokubacteria bacterium]|nr:hypothetical protein [Candidatus Rokubacteria bacterium]MBI2199568.1 hypothetical protein [Candidatus Rokubacteria bacterium]MBI3104067.1 hypothetical protein [Candidatus Rokubacteria bacterium]